MLGSTIRGSITKGKNPKNEIVSQTQAKQDQKKGDEFPSLV
jgi:hypothetical protein